MSCQSSPRPDYPLCFLISKDLKGKVIGHGGEHIREISQKCHTRIDVRKRNRYEYMITIYGSKLEACCNACKYILYAIRENQMIADGVISLRILTNNILVGRLIGKYGTTLNQIKDSTDTNIIVNSYRNMNHSDSVERIVIITGTNVENVARAGEIVSMKLQSNYEKYMAAYFPDPNYFPNIDPLNLPKFTNTAHNAFDCSSAYYGGGPGFQEKFMKTNNVKNAHKFKGGFSDPKQKEGKRQFLIRFP